MSVRRRQSIIEFLNKNGESTTGQIFDHLNKTKRNSVTMNQLTNLLSKCRAISKTGFVDVTNGKIRSRFNMWTVREGVKPKINKALGCWKIYECGKCNYRTYDFKAHPPSCMECASHSKYAKKMVVVGWLK